MNFYKNEYIFLTIILIIEFLLWGKLSEKSRLLAPTSDSFFHFNSLGGEPGF